jgi:hypothetical protein
VLITDYFKKIEANIAACPNVVESQLTKDIRSLHIGIVEGMLTFTDESVLYFIEFVSVKDLPHSYKYSYHYQDKDLNLIFRYDMAPHHKEIPSYPHHKHTSPESVVASSAPDVAIVLDEIDELINLNKR